MTAIHTLNCPACGAPVNPGLQTGQQFTCAACGSVLVLSDWTETGGLVCRNCGAENDRQSKFCISCRQALQAGCPMCYTLNSLAAQRCSKCGVDLQRAWGRQSNWLADKQRYDAQRREALERAKVEGRKAEIERLLLQLDDPQNHPLAIFCLQQIGTEAVPGLIGLLKDDDPDARYGAAHTLGLIGGQQATPALIAALDDPEPEVRFWTAAALGRLRAAEAVPALVQLLDDPEKSVRTSAAEALERINTPEAQVALRKNNKSGWWPFG